MSRKRINDREMLVWFLLQQPGVTRAWLADNIGVNVSAVQKWARGVASPNDLSTGALVALAREKFRVSVGPELAELGAARRRLYMREYFRLRRENPDLVAHERKLELERRMKTRDERNERERARWAERKDAVNAVRRIRRHSERIECPEDEQQ